MVNPPVVLDIAWLKPTLSQILATGAIGVMRYFSGDSTKNWTLEEFQTYTAGGLEVGSVWETTAGRALADYTAGQADARAADAQRAADGFPADMPIHFAVDIDTDWPSVAPYFAGAANVLTRDRIGVYGGIRVIEGAAAAGYPFLWQTDAWSGGQVSPHATLYQAGGTALGGDADINHALARDWGQYPRPEVYVATLDPQDKQDIIDGVLRGMQGGPVRDALAFADLWWLDHALAGTTTPGMDAGQVQLVTDIHRLVTELASTPKPADVAPAAAGVSPPA
jgi:hypothetical protein